MRGICEKCGCKIITDASFLDVCIADILCETCLLEWYKFFNEQDDKISGNIYERFIEKFAKEKVVFT